MEARSDFSVIDLVVLKMLVLVDSMGIHGIYATMEISAYSLAAVYAVPLCYQMKQISSSITKMYELMLYKYFTAQSTTVPKSEPLQNFQ